METTDTILHYWFGASADDTEAIREKSALWWKKDPKVDEEIRRRFEMLLDAEVRNELESWGKRPRGQLARILLCDQFPRNMYRNMPRSFAYDERARRLAREALDQGMDKKLRLVERVFLYLPYEHSEDTEDQATSVRFYSGLHEEAPQTAKPTYRIYLDYALKHKEIIDRFGRFPHRNAIFGRNSTPEELKFLSAPGSSF